MNITRTQLITAFSLFALILSSCGKTSEHQTTLNYDITVENDDWGTFEGNLENTVDYSDILKNIPLSADKISKVTITGAKFTLNPSAEFNMSYFTSAKVELFGGDTEMQSVATLSPISTQSNEIELTAAADANLTDYFKSGSYSLNFQLIGIEVDTIELPSTVVGEIELDLTFTIKE